ncbi:MAG TPA: hypothetical protein VM261_22705, partial [Kofleriaceae bacterium]|nr:hypothetical protein [Kofleriaceae bacterium]
LYCRPHNQYEAERQLGVDFMEAKRAEAIAERAAAAAAKATATEARPDVRGRRRGSRDDSGGNGASWGSGGDGREAGARHAGPRGDPARALV